MVHKWNWIYPKSHCLMYDDDDEDDDDDDNVHIEGDVYDFVGFQ
jgi:hypothetical protein